MKLIIVPDNWECSLEECPPGFFVYENQLCFKSEYRTDNKIDAFCCSGEFFCKGSDIIVQPVIYKWEKE